MENTGTEINKEQTFLNAIGRKLYDNFTTDYRSGEEVKTLGVIYWFMKCEFLDSACYDTCDGAHWLVNGANDKEAATQELLDYAEEYGVHVTEQQIHEAFNKNTEDSRF